MSREHRFAIEQIVEVEDEVHVGRVQIAALLPTRCSEHSAPKYGCVAGDQHFSFCEECIKPLSTHSKRKLN
jgi:hypothetical protein